MQQREKRQSFILSIFLVKIKYIKSETKISTKAKWQNNLQIVFDQT